MGVSISFHFYFFPFYLKYGIISNTMKTNKNGFTLVELLVVIGIIGILSTVMMVSFGTNTASARAAQCMTNMHNLAQAVHASAMEQGYYPLAGSTQWCEYGVDGQGKLQKTFHHHKGWISCLCGDETSNENRFSNSPHEQVKYELAQQFYEPGSAEERNAHFCVTNGAIWAHCGRNLKNYVCPEHIRAFKKTGKLPMWSYVMNSYFCWDTSAAKNPETSSQYAVRETGRIKNADRLLLFAEVPIVSLGDTQEVQVDNNNELTDTVLQARYEEDFYKNVYCKEMIADSSGAGNEQIGFNHQIGKGNYVAHVCFLDGHAEKIAFLGGMNQGSMKELTMWLCQGDTFAKEGAQYRRTHKVTDE